MNDSTGSAIIWMRAFKTKEIEVSVDGQYYPKITAVYPTSITTFGTKYAVTVIKLSEVSHIFETRESGTIPWLSGADQWEFQEENAFPQP